MSDDVRIVVRVDDRTAAGFRDVDGRLRTLDGRFAASAGSMSRSSSKANGALLDLKASLLSLAPAAVPVAAAMAPIAVHAGAAGLAVAAFGAAVIPQIANLKDAAAAQTKYTDAVTKYGAHSQQAVAAQQQAAEVLKGMPQATQRAAAGYSNLKDQFKDFSDSTAQFTMVPVEKSFAILGQIIPKLTPMVEGTSTQLGRLMDVAGGGINTSGFDALSKKVSDFANQSLKGATDKAIHFMRVLSEGNASGPIASFFEYARQQGPAVKELISNVAEAVSNLLEGAAQAGPGMLTLVNAMAKLVASVPPELIGNLMSIYAAFKLIKLAGAGVGAIAGGFATLATRVTALRTAATLAGGGIAGMTTALGTLSTGGKAALALGVVGGLALAMHKLSDNKAAVEVDALSTSLNTLLTTGKLTGALSTNFDDISKSIAMVSKGASDNKVAGLVSDFGSWIGIATGPGISTAKKNVDAWDKSMANLVRAGHVKEAKAQYDLLKRSWAAGGGDMGRLKKFTDDYRGALADQAFEAKMAAESMGLFGQAAAGTQAKLDAQKNAADGLRQSIQALNDVQRAGLGGMIGFEGAIDAATSAAKENGKVLSMSHGQLNLNSEKARTAASALSDLAAKTDEAAAASRESTGSWSGAVEIYERGRAKLVETAVAMGLTKKQAQQLASQILKTPDKTAMLRGDIKDLSSKIATAKEKLKHATPSQTAKIKGNIADLQRKIGQAQAAIWGLRGRTITVQVRTAGIAAAQAAIAALGGIPAMPHARGGLVHGYAGGGAVQAYPGGGLVQGPGTSTSDSITALSPGGGAYRVSDSEYVVRAAAVKKYGVGFMDALNSGSLKLAGFAKGGLTKKQKAARAKAKAQADAENQARHDAMGDLTVSRFGHMAGYKRSEFQTALGKPDSMSSLVNALNQWRGIIMKSTHGGQEKFLLKALDSAGKRLINYEKTLTKVTASLEKAKDKLDNLKQAAAQLSDSVKGGVLSSANITRGAGGDAPVTTKSIMAGLTASRDKASSFASALKQLEKKGLSKDLIKQIAEAGIEGGGLETAGALLGASSSEIKSMNKLQGQINTAAGSAGKTTADAVYKDAIARQAGIVKSLGAQQAKLTTAMDNLAKAMNKLIEKALGKKAKAGKKAAGGIVGAAASGGMRGGLTWVGEQEPELLDLPVGSRVWSGPDSRRKAAQAPWASMLNEPRRPGGRGAAAGGGSVQPIVVHQTIELDGRVLARQIFDPLRAEIAHKGGSVQRTLGQGAG
jgi:hypothetical protein